MHIHPTALLLYCRPGFERECAQEIADRCADLGVEGEAGFEPDQGWVIFEASPRELSGLRKLRWNTLAFARQLLWAGDELSELPAGDRIQPLLQAARTLCPRYASVILETPDTNEGKSLSSLTRRLEGPLHEALLADGLLPEAFQPGLPRLHLFFLSGNRARVALSWPGNRSEWPCGIPRLRMPKEAPSRATLKLAEAFHVLLSEAEQQKNLKPGMKAVDLGAAPGGWTWQLVARHIHVTAVDNGNMAPDLLDTGLVQHRREDGFRFRPKKPVDWLVCDIVEQPRRIATLIGDWAAQGLCRFAIFNLKLPMKKRYDELQRCRALIEDELLGLGYKFELRLRQLYHDREEVTGYLQVGPRQSAERKLR